MWQPIAFMLSEGPHTERKCFICLFVHLQQGSSECVQSTAVKETTKWETTKKQKQCWWLDLFFIINRRYSYFHLCIRFCPEPLKYKGMQCCSLASNEIVLLSEFLDVLKLSFPKGRIQSPLEQWWTNTFFRGDSVVLGVPLELRFPPTTTVMRIVHEGQHSDC